MHILEDLNGFWWLLLLLGPLLFLQRRLHRDIQAIFLLLTRRAELTLTLFSLVFLPGILLHEASHFLMATILRVPTGRFSIFPRPMPDGKLQLGFVETAKVDWVRDALIGAAPLLSGGILVTYLGWSRLGLSYLWESVLNGTTLTLTQAISTWHFPQDFWLWFYLVFTISSTMLPSASDRRTWLPLGLVLGLLISSGILAGAGPWLMQHLAPPFNLALKTLALVIGTSVAAHVVLVIPIGLIRILLSRLSGFVVK